MSKFQNRPGQGVLLVNSNKSQERQPDYKGEIILDKDYGAGSVIGIAGWRKTTKMNHLISLSIDKKQDSGQQWPKPVEDDNSVPF